MEEIYLKALELAAGLGPAPKNIDRVGRSTSADAARWAFEQWDLRRRATAKFSRAAEMYFVREALEQATSEAVADYHASLFPSGEPVLDLTCGIGADAIALARRGPVTAFELDGTRAECAARNLAIYGLRGDVITADCLAAEWRADYAFADPARRIGGRRSIDISEFLPDPHELARRMRDLELGLIKLTPMLPDDVLDSLGVGVEFVSYGGECREAIVLLGRRARRGRFAVHVESDKRLAESDPPPMTETLGEWLYDVDPAAVRAHAVGDFAREHGLRVLGDSRGYLTGGEADGAWIRGYQVLDAGAYDEKRIDAALSLVDAKSPVFKQRRANQDLDRLGRKFKRTGSRDVVVAFYRVGPSLRWVLAEPRKFA